MHPHAETDMSVCAVASIADDLGAIGHLAATPAVERSAASAMQVVTGGGEIGDDGLDDDLIAIVAVAG